MAGLAGVYAVVGTTLLPVLVCTAVGAEWGRRKIAYPASFISTLVSAVAVPALVFHTLSTTRLAPGVILKVGLAAALGLLIMALLSALILRLSRLPVRSLIPACTFPNAGNLGLPLSQLAFGEAGLSVAVAFFAVCTFFQHTFGVQVLAATRMNARALFNPVVLATLASVCLRAAGIAAPEWVLKSSQLLGSLTVPLMLISLGYTLVTMSHGSILKGSYIGLIRLATGLLVGTAVVALLALPAEIAGVTLLQMMMPVAVVNYLYAQRYTDQSDTVAGAILVSTVGFLLLSPLALWYVNAPAAPG